MEKILKWFKILLKIFFSLIIIFFVISQVFKLRYAIQEKEIPVSILEAKFYMDNGYIAVPAGVPPALSDYKNVDYVVVPATVAGAYEKNTPILITDQFTFTDYFSVTYWVTLGLVSDSPRTYYVLTDKNGKRYLLTFYSSSVYFINESGDQEYIDEQLLNVKE